MYDVVPSPYGPRELDCTGDPACWPWNTTHIRGTRPHVAAPAYVPDDALAEYVPVPRPIPDRKAIRPCTAHGCSSPSAAVHRRTHPALYDFCDRHRIAGMTRIRHGRHPLVVADDMTVGSRIIGRPRSCA